MSFTIGRFADIAHQLPRDCWAVRRNARNDGELDDELVAVHEGPLTLATLDLDAPLDGNAVFLIVVRGDLTVEGAIFNASSDSATGLLVEGNLTCRNAAVGGQEVYVRGNLDVQELFWGDYNHGHLIVVGHAAAQVLIASDGYDLTVRGEERVVHAIVDERPDSQSWRLESAKGLAEYIEPAFIADDEFVYLRRDEILAAWAQGASVIHPCQAADMSARIDQRFADQTMSTDLIQRIVAPEHLPAGGEGDAVGSVSFVSGDMLCRITLSADGANAHERLLYFRDANGLTAYVGLFNTADTLMGRLKSALGRLRGSRLAQTTETRWKTSSPETPWKALGPRSPQAAHALLRRGWHAALGFVVAQTQLRQAITPHALRALLSLPVVEPYDDFESDERNGFWAGSTYCAFRQQGADETETPLLHVTVEEDGADLYFYEIVTTADASETVEVTYCPHRESDEESHLGYTGGPALDQAIQLFQLASRNIIAMNDELLAGRLRSDDGFAMRYWRQKGYLKKRLPG